MSGLPDPDDPRDDAVLAAEYALRLMDGAARQEFEARMDDDPALRRLVAAWDTDLAPLADAVPPVAPPPRVKAAIEARLFPAPRRRSVRGWIGGLVAAAAVAVLVLVIVPPTDIGPAPVAIAEIAATDGPLRLAVALSGDRLRVTRTAGAAPSGRVLEVWLIAAGAAAPVSLGVLPADPVAELALTDTTRAALVGGVLAVSDEPPGGSPTGAPTGTVLATGAITSL